MHKITIKPGYVLFFIGLLFFECANFFVNVSFLSSYLRILKAISFVILTCSGIIINMNEKNLSSKNIVILIILFFISIISFYITKSTMFIEILLVSFNVIGMKFDKVIKMDLIIKVFVILFVVLMNKLGYANSEFIVTRDGDFVRNSYGFYHPNTFGMILMMTFFEFIYLRRKKINYKDYIIAIILLLFIKFTCDTRTVIYCILFYMIFLLIKNQLSFKSKIINVIKDNLYLILLFISIGLTILYMNNYQIAIQLNQFMSNRLYLQAFFFDFYDINFIGNNIDYVRTLDNGYIKIILNYGIIITIVVAIIFNFNLKKSTKFQEKELILLFLVILLFSLSESFMLYIYNNIFMIYYLCKNEEVSNVRENIGNNTMLQFGKHNFKHN